jgi:hypothetical protein
MKNREYLDLTIFNKIAARILLPSSILSGRSYLELDILKLKLPEVNFQIRSKSEKVRVKK